jgi:uncharacterized protein YidB (DUF937 family)
MGLLDMVTSLAGQLGGGQAAQVGGGLMQELESRPGGISGIFQAFQQNGLGGLVQQWASGQTGGATPDQIEQGLCNTGIIESIAQRTGMSPDTIKAGLAMVLPMLIHHFVSGGHVTADGQATGAPAPDSGSILQSVLGKLL